MIYADYIDQIDTDQISDINIEFKKNKEIKNANAAIRGISEFDELFLQC